IAPKRFRALFFVARGDGAVQVDGSEIHEHRWISPSTALEQQRARELELPPPQYVTLLTLASHSSVDSALEAVSALDPVSFSPRFVQSDGRAACLYEGDAGYDAAQLDLPGPRHRLWL